MYHERRQSPLRGCLVFGFTIAVLLGTVFAFFNLDSLRGRLGGLPLQAETYVRQFLPTPALPTPPPASVDTQSLLALQPGTDPDSAGPSYLESALADDPDSAGVGAVPDSAGGAGGVQLVENSATNPDDIAPDVRLEGTRHEWQTWNNCGPTTITMQMSYYNHPETQVQAAAFTKPNEKDKNVSPDELLAFAQSRGFDGFVGVGGSLELLQRFLSNGFPVTVEFWTERDDRGGMGHYRLLTGYDADRGIFIAQDSLHGANIEVDMASFDNDWQVFNRTYILIYPTEQATLAHALAGETASPPQMYENALRQAQIEAQANPNGQAFAWFNIGTNYARLGQSEAAAGAFDEARRLGLPYRMLWYQFDIYETYLAQERYQEMLDLTTATLEATGGLEEIYYYRGLTHQALGQTEAAQADFEAALDYNANFTPASLALNPR